MTSITLSFPKTSKFREDFITKEDKVLETKNLSCKYLVKDSFFSKKKEYFNASINYANLKKQLHLIDEALEILKAAIKYNPDNFLLHHNIANVYHVVGDFRNSDLHFEKSCNDHNSWEFCLSYGCRDEKVYLFKIVDYF